MNNFERIEYVSLRLIRKFVFSERLANRLARWLPYYAPSVNEAQPELIVSEYSNRLTQAGLSLAGMRVLEVGAGRTNAVGYGLLAAGASSAILLEPFVDFDDRRDIKLRLANSKLTSIDPHLARRVGRFDEIEAASVDVLLSNSVLEHVQDLPGFFADCKRVLAPDGIMLHKVDYRDHFFKYPYGFLTFNDKTWARWLDPGDLPRWRLADHLEALAALGFYTDVLDRQVAADEFARIRPQLVGRFATATPGVEVIGATLLAHIAQ